jgi:DnaJ-domain-containing protein 1
MHAAAGSGAAARGRGAWVAPPCAERRLPRARRSIVIVVAATPHGAPPSSSSSPAEVLGVASGASKHVARRAYRTLVLKYHPDRNTTADVRFVFAPSL